MLRPFAWYVGTVARCCDLLDIVVCSLKLVKLLVQQVPTFLLFCDQRSVTPTRCARLQGLYYSLAVRRFQTILGVGLRIFPHFHGGLRLTNHSTVTENYYFFARFSVFMHFHERITVLEVTVSV